MMQLKPTMMGFSYEKRSLKRPRLGPPDVYPQEPKQKEDELTTVNVKHGFSTMPQLTDEFGTARNCNITASKIGAYFNAIIGKKEELNTLPDSGRKRQQINPKDNFWPATARTKNAIEAWFRDLAGNKPLISLSKKAPNFNKKEEIFMLLCEYQVPMLRAAWFIKLSSAYTVAVSEAKIKKRQLPDPTQEWTGTLLKFLKDQLTKLQDYYNNSNGTMNDEQKLVMKQWQYTQQLMKTLYQDGLLDRQDVLQWILDLLDKTKASQLSEDGMFRLLLPLALQYLEEFVQSELLARKLSYLASRKLATLCYGEPGFSPSNNLLNSSNAMSNNSNNTSSGNVTTSSHSNSNLNNSSNNGNKDNIGQASGNNNNNNSNSANSNNNSINPVNNAAVTMLNEYLSCLHHRDIVLGLSAIIQVVTLECPTALVWNCIGEGKSSSVLNGSPLDVLPCSPASLPMPQRTSNPHIRNQLRLGEELVRQRSVAAEARWSCDEWQQSSAGVMTSKVLTALDALDRHSFERIDSTNSLDTLYTKIFTVMVAKENSSSSPSTNQEDSSANNNSSNNNNSNNGNGNNSREPKAEFDEPIVEILCEWAVSGVRYGEHRGMAVAKLLEKRQAELTGNDCDNGDDKESTASMSPGLPVFQSLLMKFLDFDAPILEENPSASNRTMFTNLVHLFAELVRHDVFSHDAYMCTLISRGDLINVTNPGGASGGNTPHPGSNKPVDTPGAQNSAGVHLDEDSNLFDMKPTKMELQEHGRANDYDESKNIDDDLEKLLQHIKEEQQNSMDAPDSPKDEPGSLVPGNMNGNTAGGLDSSGAGDADRVGHVGGIIDRGSRPSRHLLYTTHFPLPQDEGNSHDCNQRHVLLYGVGRVRDEARHVVKRISKDICKLFSKKFSIDVAEGGKVKKHSRNEFNFEATTARVQSLSYFDQHVVTYQCSVTVLEMINAFATGTSNYLPVQEHVAFLFDLMELALNIDCLIDVCIQILKEVPEVESQLVSKGSGLVRSYTPSLVLYVVGVLRRYHCCLLLSPEQTIAVFDGLCRVVKHVSNPGDCCSVERCVLSHLYDLYSRCSLLKSRPHGGEPFSNAYPKIKSALYTALQPAPSNHTLTQFMSDVVLTIRRGANVSNKIEPSWARQLNESASNRYSFVCNTIFAVSGENDIDRLNELGHLAAELTACCSTLSIEWLGVLMALCCSSNHPSYYMDVLQQVDVHDHSIHNSLGVFTSILIARHCFSLEDFVVKVALPSLLTVFNEGRADPDMESEAGARLTLHLLLRLFKTIEVPQPSLYSVGTSPHPLPSNSAAASIKLSCDRHLLAAAHNNIRVGPVLAVLKAILVVADATANRLNSSGSIVKKGDGCQVLLSNQGSSGKLIGSGGSSSNSELSISHILGTSDIMTTSTDDLMLDLGVVDLEPVSRSSQRGVGGIENNIPNLSELAHVVLTEICSQEWVLERCLQNPEELCQPDMLLDSLLTPKQAQRLLHMICYPHKSHKPDDNLEQKTIITNILENLEQWTLRMSWLDMQLMYKQYLPNSNELNQWLDMVAKAAIDVFQLTSTAPTSTEIDNARMTKSKPQTQSMWLVAPLISKLPSAVQGRVLKVAGQVLESGNWGNNSSSGNSSGTTNSSGGGGGSGRSSKGERERENSRNTPQHTHSLIQQQQQQQSTQQHLTTTQRHAPHHQPFLSLVLTCLKGQDDQREGLLVSLHSQLSQCLTISKEDRVNNIASAESCKGRAIMQDALLLRFSLVGGMFDTIQRNTTLTTDWAILLVQLISYGVIDLNNNSELFTIVIDMLATLIHSTLVSDSQSEKGDENRKHYQNLMKKLKKELGDRNSSSIQHVRQLLPLPKQVCEVIACEQMGLLHDMKGNKIAFDSTDKQGLQVSEKQRVSPWDVLEGHKNPAPLSWAWFGAVRMERKPLWYEENHRLLKYHTHSLVKSPSYFLEPVPLPPEDLDPPQEKPCPCVYCNQMKGGGVVAGPPDTPNSVEQSPRGSKRGAKSGVAQRRKKQTKPGPGGITPGGHAMAPGPAGMHTQVQKDPNNKKDVSCSAPNNITNARQPKDDVTELKSHVKLKNECKNMGQGAVNYPGQANQPGMFQCQPGPPPGPPGAAAAAAAAMGAQWGGGGGGGGYTQQPQQHPPGGYYSQQLPPGVVGGGPRFERPVNQSKQALSNMLRLRMPSNQYMAQQGQPGPPQQPQGFHGGNMAPRQQFIRQQLRAQQGMGPAGMQPPPNQQPPGMFQQPPGGGGGGAHMYGNMQQQDMMSSMGQKYGAAGGGGQGGSGGGMFPTQQQASQQQVQQQQQQVQQQQVQQQAQQQVAQQQQQFGMRQQPDYMQQRVRPPYLQAPNVTMSTMGGPMSQNQQPAPPYSRAGQQPNTHQHTHTQATQQQQQQQQQQFQQQMNQQRLNSMTMRHQMMAMQQQNQQQQNQQQNPQLIAQLHRQLQQQQQQQPNQQQQGQQQPGQQGPQHNPYSHQPPPY